MSTEKILQGSVFYPEIMENGQRIAASLETLDRRATHLFTTPTAKELS